MLSVLTVAAQTWCVNASAQSSSALATSSPKTQPATQVKTVGVKASEPKASDAKTNEAKPNVGKAQTNAAPKAPASAPKASAAASATEPKSPPAGNATPAPVAPKTTKVQAPPVVPTVEPTPVVQKTTTTQSNTEQSKLVYDQAVAAYEEHRYRDAIYLFQQANSLRPNPAFSFNIGTAYEDMGDSAMALLHYRAYLRQLPKAPDREDVEDRIRRLEGVLADKGLQQVTIISNPAQATVILDGKPRGVSPWTGEIAPGAHVVTLALPGYADETRNFDLPSRRSIDVPVTLEKAEPKVVAPVIDLNQVPEPESKSSWEYVRPVTWGVLGVSVASFGAALGFELSRAALEERSEHADSEVGRRKLHQEAERSELWSKSFMMFAIGMGATSLVLGFQNIDDGLEAERQRAERVSFGCVSRHECGVSFSGAF